MQALNAVDSVQRRQRIRIMSCRAAKDYGRPPSTRLSTKGLRCRSQCQNNCKSSLLRICYSAYQHLVLTNAQEEITPIRTKCAGLTGPSALCFRLRDLKCQHLSSHVLALAVCTSHPQGLMDLSKPTRDPALGGANHSIDGYCKAVAV